MMEGERIKEKDKNKLNLEYMKGGQKPHTHEFLTINILLHTKSEQ